MNTTPPYLAFDVGSAVTRIVVGGTRTRLMTGRTSGETMADRVSAALRMAPHSAAGICLTLPDAWFSGSPAGARSYEEVRYACEDNQGVEGIIWTGQLAAVAASCGRQRGPGRYLVCDVGYAGVRTGSFIVSSQTVRTEMALDQEGGGWGDFDRAVRAIVGDDQLPGDWYAQALRQAERAREVFRNAAASPGRRDDRAYRLTGRGEHRLTAAQMMDCFAPVRERMATGIAAVSAAGSPDTVVVTGGLGWFPLAGQMAGEMAGMEAAVTGPDEAVRGGLLFARREMTIEPPTGLPVVGLPVNRIGAGLLEEESLELPWHEAFATLPEDMPPLDREELILTISGQYQTVRLPGLVPGLHRIGLRAGWSGSTVLVVRPAEGNTVHIASLTSAEVR